MYQFLQKIKSILLNLDPEIIKK